jgi:2-oxoisovalerate dehydrogenase E1 component
VVAWRKTVGDAVEAGEVIAEIETDKALVEIEAPKSGKLVQILVPVGQLVKMGGTLGVVG